MKTNPQQVDRLVRLIKKRMPRVSVVVDPPARPTGAWFIDVNAGARNFVIEFRPAWGFGLSSSRDEAFGEGPDEFWDTEELVVQRMVALRRSGKNTQPQRVQWLQELRTRRHVSQIDLATRLGVKQPTVSKMERRDDVSLSTLRRFIQALGGQLHVTAEFNDGFIELGPADLPDVATERR